jgi:uracil-DNA glycosylase
MTAVKIEESWKALLNNEFSKPYFSQLTAFVKKEYAQAKVYPPANKIFEAFNLTPVSNVKVVILGQDPYHGPNQAHGLCFSVNHGIAIPPSLQNIYKELKNNFHEYNIPKHGCLESWAMQGVLLLNATLTVRASMPGSHQKKGWETFTDAVIKAIATNKQNLVFMLWGRYAQSKAIFIPVHKHLVLKAAHPSPLSAHNGFFGCNHFKLCNNYLQHNQIQPINWQI